MRLEPGQAWGEAWGGAWARARVGSVGHALVLSLVILDKRHREACGEVLVVAPGVRVLLLLLLLAAAALALVLLALVRRGRVRHADVRQQQLRIRAADRLQTTECHGVGVAGLQSGGPAGMGTRGYRGQPGRDVREWRVGRAGA